MQKSILQRTKRALCLYLLVLKVKDRSNIAIYNDYASYIVWFLHVTLHSSLVARKKNLSRPARNEMSQLFIRIFSLFFFNILKVTTLGCGFLNLFGTICSFLSSFLLLCIHFVLVVQVAYEVTKSTTWFFRPGICQLFQLLCTYSVF